MRKILLTIYIIRLLRLIELYININYIIKIKIKILFDLVYKIKY